MKQNYKIEIENMIYKVLYYIFMGDIAVEKKEPIRFNKELLDQFCKDNNIILCGEYDKLNRASIITGICIDPGCNETFEKNFRQLLISNGYCKKHTLLNGSKKSKQTCLKNFGAEHYLQTDEGKERVKNTCMEIYGVDNPSKNEAIKEKMKETFQAKYGVDTPLKCEEIKQKMRNTNLERYQVENTFQYEPFKEKSKETNMKNHGVENPMQCDAIREKMEQTMLERHGVAHPLQSEVFLQKSKDTCMKNHGVEYSLQSPEVRAKSVEKWINTYGVDNPIKNEDIRQKMKNTNLDRFGFESPFQNEEIKQKIKETFLQKYGVDHPMQHPSVMAKQIRSSFRTKTYILPSGAILLYQGYENFAIDELLQSGIPEQEIINGCENIPEIWYKSSSGKTRKHYVDLYIPSSKKCIEVKSTWTVSDAKDSEEIFLKQKAAKELGYRYEIWVYDGTGQKVECFV